MAEMQQWEEFARVRSERTRRERRIRAGVAGALTAVILVALLGLGAAQALGGDEVALGALAETGISAVSSELGAERDGGNGTGDGSGNDAPGAEGGDAAGENAGTGGLAATDATASGKDSRASDGPGADGAVAIAVTDSEERRVSLAAAPSRVAILDSFAGEAAIMVGAGDQVIGVPAGVASDVLLRELCPRLNGEMMSTAGNTVNIEALMEAQCDMAVVKPSLSKDERAKLDKVGIPYIVVGYTDFDGQMAALRLVGTLFGGEAERRSEKLATFYEQTASLIEEVVATIPENQRVRVYHAINDALLTDGAQSLGADWVKRAGCVNVSTHEEGQSHADFNVVLEQVFVWDPDLIVCNAAATAARIKDDPQWVGLRAVREGKVASLPVGATRWGQRGSVETALAMLWLCQEVYPEVCDGRVDFEGYVRDYYRDYLGLAVDHNLFARMLSGEGLRASGSGSGAGQ